MSDEAAKKRKAEYDREYRAKNAASIKQEKKEYYEANKQRISVYNKARYDNKKEEIKANVKARYEEKAPEIREYARQYRRERPGESTANSAIHRCKNRGLLPDWLTEDDFEAMKRIYEEAARLQSEDGIVRHVDHIVPLAKGGLHCPHNLQILTAEENRAKGIKLLTENKDSDD